MIRRIAALALVAGLAGACTPSVPSGDVPRGPTPSASPTDSDLALLLFDEVPAGYVVDADATRSLTLDQAVEGADDPDELRTRYKQEGFVTGFARLWSSDDDSTNVIYAYVYEFATADGAKAEQDSGLAEARRDQSTIFDVPQIAGALGVTQSTSGPEGDAGTFHAVSFVRGVRYYLVAIGGPDDHTTQEAIDLAIKMDAAAR